MGKRLTIALAVFAILAVLLGTYTAGYLLLPTTYYWYASGSATTSSPTPGFPLATVHRIYREQWMATAFLPAASVEGWLRGVEVYARWGGGQRRLADPYDYETFP